MPTVEEIRTYLRQIKPSLHEEGIEVIGVFVSYARGDADDSSDIDVLVETTPRLAEKYGPYGAFNRLADLKTALREHFGRNVDLADRAGLSAIGGKYILPEVLHV
ncbi:nucleotidyltransferase family protein [Endothiovibrio diazotrophicus]